MKKNLEKQNKNKGFHYEILKLLANDENSETNESNNNLNEAKNEGNKNNKILKNNKSEDYIYNIPLFKKPKNKKNQFQKEK